MKTYDAKGNITNQTCYQNRRMAERLSLCGVDKSKTNEDKQIWVEEKWPNGKPRGRRQELNGKLEGIEERFFESGRLKSRARYEASQRHGPFEEFFENGKLKRKGTYARTFKDGLWEEFSEEGEKIREERFADRRLTELKIWYMNGQPEMGARHEKREKEGFVYATYYDDGSPNESGFCLSPGFPERPTCYSWLGERISREHDGQWEKRERYGPEGLQTSETIDRRGKRKVAERYEKKRLAERKTFDLEDNRLLETETFHPDGSTKSKDTVPPESPLAL